METRIQTNFNRLPLLNLSPIECKEDIDERFEKCYIILQDLIKGSSESEAHDTLMATVSKSTQDHDNVCLGLLTSILVDPPNAPRYYRDLTYVSRDGMNFVITLLNHIIIERYPKLHDGCRGQLIWLLRELIKNSITSCETIAIALLRQIAGGDISTKNLWLTEKMLDLLIDNRSWVDKNNILIATTVYTYLRLIVDHGSPNLTLLRQKEIDFCSSLLKEKFTDCLVIGRDLVRLLQNVARIPEFEKIWKDIFTNPTSLSPNFQGVLQLMSARTSRRFLQSRLTPDMEKKICYLTSYVKFGQQRRYQEWFQRQYLSTPESQSLRCDLIRYICGVIHPSNEVLCSEIIPRWAIIGWILSSCTSNVAAANAKLSLFYDWLFYDKEKDNIMNIEPAILVMFHSMRNHSVITVGLLDFLCRYPVIVIKDLALSELRTIVEFIYKGEVSVSRDKLSTVLQAAKELEVSGLSDLKIDGHKCSVQMQMNDDQCSINSSGRRKSKTPRKTITSDYIGYLYQNGGNGLTDKHDDDDPVFLKPTMDDVSDYIDEDDINGDHDDYEATNGGGIGRDMIFQRQQQLQLQQQQKYHHHQSQQKFQQQIQLQLLQDRQEAKLLELHQQLRQASGLGSSNDTILPDQDDSTTGLNCSDGYNDESFPLITDLRTGNSSGSSTLTNGNGLHDKNGPGNNSGNNNGDGSSTNTNGKPATPDFLQPRGPGRPRKGNKSNDISPCPECNKVFVRPDVLKLHYRSVHLNERHPCNMCPKIFKWPGDLSKHKRTKHSEVMAALNAKIAAAIS